MAIDLQAFAQQIIDAADRIDRARDPQSALDALEGFNSLVEDQHMLRLLATAFQLSSTVALQLLDDELGPDASPGHRVQSRRTDP